MLVIDGGGPGFNEHAAFTFLNSEDTVYAFSVDDVEAAVRNTYQADASGVVYAVTFVRPELLIPSTFGDVAGEWAAIWNANASVPGVTDIAVTQRVKPLGGLEDVADVSVTSTSGRSSNTVQLSQADVIPDLFAVAVRKAVARLDAIEGASA